jgi:hypothetical protein
MRMTCLRNIAGLDASDQRLTIKKRDRGRHCLFRRGAFLAARIAAF